MSYINDRFRNTRNAIDEIERNVDLNVIPPQNINPDGTSTTIFTNPNTGATYKYIYKTPKAIDGVLLPENQSQIKNSWVFYPPDVEIGIEVFDPSQGNLWVDDDDVYIVYVYNNGEIIDKPYGWYALTEKKKGYDYFVIQTASDPKDLALIGESDAIANDSYVYGDGQLAPLVLKQGFLYYNTAKNDLYVWKGETDQYGNTGGFEGQWIQITKQTVEPTNTDIIIKTSYDLLLERVEALELAISQLS
jgi:hypothetical protein